MSRSRSVIFTTVSALAFLSFISVSQATTQRALDFGLLKAQGTWRVGTVDAGSAPYCAMVNKYDRQVVLAFALNPEGFGSVALDFRDPLFTPGESYQVTLAPSAGAVQRLTGQASSERSLVVQIGSRDSFFEALEVSGNVRAILPSFEIGFTLRNFVSAYEDLKNCAAVLPVAAPSVPVPAVKSAAVDNVERELAQIEMLNNRVEQLEAEIAARKQVNAKADIVWRDRELNIAPPSRESIEEIRKGAPINLIAAEEKPVAIEWQDQPKVSDFVEDTKVPDVQRTLLVSSSRPLSPRPGTVSQAPVIDSGATARALEAQEVTVQNAKLLRVEEMQKMENFRKGLTDRQSALDKVEARKKEVTEAQVAAFNKEDKKLQDKIARVEETRKAVEEKLAAVEPAAGGTEKKALKADLVAQQGQIAALDKQRLEKTQALTKNLSETHTNFEGKIAALTAERDGLKQKLAVAEGRIAGLETQLTEKTAHYDALKEQLAQAKFVAADAPKDTVAESERLVKLQLELDEARRQIALLNKRGTPLAANISGRTLRQSELAELQEYRRRFGAHKQQQAAYAPDFSDLPVVSTPAPSLVNATKVERKKIASIGAGSDLTAPPVSAAPVQPVEVADAPAPVDAAEYAAIMPAAGEAAAKTDIEWDETPAPEKLAPLEETPQKTETPKKKKLFGFIPMGYETDKPEIDVVVEDKEAAVIPVAPAQVQETAPVSQASANRAEAFLDQIMTYHRDDDAVPPASIAEAPVVATELAVIEPAAGQPAVTPYEYNALPVSRAPEVQTRTTLTLENLLSTAGLGTVGFIPVKTENGEIIEQWTAGVLSGMYEQMAASGSMDGQVQEYLDRYREDCPGQLDVNVSPRRSTSAGEIVTTDISCDIPGNAYTSSFVFLKEGGDFVVLLHTGVPKDAGAVKSAAQKIRGALEDSSGLELRSVSRKAAAVSTTGTLRFNIPDATVTSPAVHADEFETIVVQ